MVIAIVPGSTGDKAEETITESGRRFLSGLQSETKWRAAIASLPWNKDWMRLLRAPGESLL